MLRWLCYIKYKINGNVDGILKWMHIAKNNFIIRKKSWLTTGNCYQSTDQSALMDLPDQLY